MAMKTGSQPRLTRAFGLLHDTALNISNMVGIGPFITIPLMMASMGAMLGWGTGALIVISDGLIWSELGAALPGSGGSYHFLRDSAWLYIKVGLLTLLTGILVFFIWAKWKATWPFSQERNL
jgi:amino acid transporter